MSSLIPRSTQSIFALNSGDIGIPGTGVSNISGVPTLSNNLDSIMGATAFENGFDAMTETNSNSYMPFLQELNGLFYAVTAQLAYIFQQGIPEYDAGTNYNVNAFAMSPGTSTLYMSLSASNLGNALSDGTHWVKVGDLSKLPGTQPLVTDATSSLSPLSSGNLELSQVYGPMTTNGYLFLDYTMNTNNISYVISVLSDNTSSPTTHIFDETFDNTLGQIDIRRSAYIPINIGNYFIIITNSSNVIINNAKFYSLFA